METLFLENMQITFSWNIMENHVARITSVYRVSTELQHRVNH